MGAATTGRKLDRFLTDLSALVEALPSPEAKARMDADLGSLIKFLQNFRKQLDALPTDAGAEQIASTIEAVKDFVRIAEADPTMCRVLGLSERPRPNGGQRRQAKASGQDAAKALDGLRQMSSDEVERALSDRASYSIPTLKAIAMELGLRIPSRRTRLSIVERITKTLANSRGYQYLREGTHGNQRLEDSRAG